MIKRKIIGLVSAAIILSPAAYINAKSCIGVYQSLEPLTLLAKVKTSLKSNQNSFPALIVSDQIREHIDGVIQNYQSLIKTLKKEGVENQVEYNLNNAEILLNRFNKIAQQTEVILQKGGQRTEKLSELEESLRECFGHLKTCDSNIRLTLNKLRIEIANAQEMIDTIKRDSDDISRLMNSSIMDSDIPNQMKTSVIESIKTHLENLDLIRNQIKLAIQVQQQQMTLLEHIGSSDISRAYAALARLEILGARDLRALDLKQYNKTKEAAEGATKIVNSDHPFVLLTKDQPISKLGENILNKVAQKELTSVVEIVAFLIHLKENRSGESVYINLSDIKAITEAFGFASRNVRDSHYDEISLTFFRHKDHNSIEPFDDTTRFGIFRSPPKSNHVYYYENYRYKMMYHHSPVVTMPWLFFFMESITLPQMRDYLNWLEVHYAEATTKLKTAHYSKLAQVAQMKKELKTLRLFTKARATLKKEIEILEKGFSEVNRDLALADAIQIAKTEEISKFKDMLNTIEPLQGESILIKLNYLFSKFGSVDNFEIVMPVK